MPARCASRRPMRRRPRSPRRSTPEIVQPGTRRSRQCAGGPSRDRRIPRTEPTIANDRATQQRSRRNPASRSTGRTRRFNEVLGIFARFTGRTILPSKNVTGNVSANIINLPWDVALKEVMNANGYDVTVNPDGVIVVDTFEAIAAVRRRFRCRRAPCG